MELGKENLDPDLDDFELLQTRQRRPNIDLLNLRVRRSNGYRRSTVVFSPTECIIDIAQDFLCIIYIPLLRVIYARYTTGGAFEIMASYDTKSDIWTGQTVI